jgi:hypothetical protein
MSPIDLRNVNISRPNAKIRYSYQDMTMSKKSNNVYIPNDSTQSFSFDDDGVSISGKCIEISITRPSHIVQLGVGMEQDADLVLKHVIPNSNTNFYVVIPLVQDPALSQDLNSVSSESSEIERMVETEKSSTSTGTSYNFNQDLKKIKPNIVCYKDSKTASYVFVFDKPILTKKEMTGGVATQFNGVQNTSTGKGKRKKTTSTAFIVKNNQNVEDTIECEYVTQTDATAKPQDTKLVVNIFIWVFLTLGLILSLNYFLNIINDKVADKLTIFTIIGGIGSILLITFIRLFSTTSNKKIQYGSMMFFSLATMGLSLMAYNGMLFKTPSP